MARTHCTAPSPLCEGPDGLTFRMSGCEPFDHIVYYLVTCFEYKFQSSKRPFRACYARLSSPLRDVLLARPNGFVGGREIALVERAHLARLESPDNGVQHAAVVEDHEVVLVPVMRVYQLGITDVNLPCHDMTTTETTYLRRDGRTLHLVQDVSHGAEVRDVRTVRIERTFALRTVRERGYEELLDAAGMHLEVEATGNRVLPQLHANMSRICST